MTDDGLLQKIDTIPIMGRSIIEHDPASRAFPVRGVIVQPDMPRRNKTWRRGNPYNQGQTSSCVGQSFKGVLNTAPNSIVVTGRIRLRYDALAFYHGGQDNDEWPGGEPQYYGTSALGVCKYLKEAGIIEEYRWCFGLDDVLDTLSQHGPVAIGVNWLRDMMETDVDGFIHVSGEPVGGHEVELHGINKDKKFVTGTNSWGTSWGRKGRFKLSWDDLDVLLKATGDATTVVQVIPR